jgi:hypothetical protein
VNSYDAEESELLVTTENATVSENITGIDDSNRNTVVIENKTPIRSDDKKEIDKPESSLDDVIELNVGGQRITTYRSTLTAVPNSKLALLFTKDYKNITKSTSKGTPIYFFDYNPAQFEYLLDQLRAIKRMPQTPLYELNIVEPMIDVRFNFSDMLFELGLNRKLNRMRSEQFLSLFLQLNGSCFHSWVFILVYK